MFKNGVTVVLAVIVLLLCTLILTSCASFVDVRPVKHITEPFISALSDKNIETKTTFQCGSNYRKDWGPGTYMRLSGKAFVWTDSQGLVHLHAFTMDPPMSLEGYKPPMTLRTADVDMDGNIVVGDPGYWIRYQLWQTRPCVDFTTMLQENTSLGAAWNYWLQQNNDAHKKSQQWEALGLGSDGRAQSYANTSLESIMFVDLGEVEWEYTGSAVGYDQQPEKQSINLSSLWFFGAAAILGGIGLLLIFVSPKERVYHE